jgi:colanic acid biosynthesis protein WcaH
METHDERIPEETFAEFLSRLPQVSVELFLETERGVLLVRRTNEPAKGEWFWPGTRLYKGERFDDAARRLAEEELGLDVNVGEHLGTYEHFWDTGAFDGVDSTHTVNVVYRAEPADPGAEIDLDGQHDDVMFVSELQDRFHEYVNEYLRDAGYGGVN